MLSRYVARGNVYVIATPDEVFEARDNRRTNSSAAATSSAEWAPSTVRDLCSAGRWDPTKPATEVASDGLLIGPFSDTPPFDLLIVNTDGSLAERSDNGLTIFAHFLRDKLPEHSQGSRYALRVTSVRPGASGLLQHEVETVAVRRQADGVYGFTVDMGRPILGAKHVGIDTELPTGDLGGGNHIAPLASIDERWRTSVLVEIGNPHCVTLVPPSQVPPFAELSGEHLHHALKVIAFAPSGHDRTHHDFPRGINLQWAGVEQPGIRGGAPAIVRASVFERGEGATLSSGSSAVAVASAVWHAGLIASSDVLVEMPGGRVPIELELTDDGSIDRAFLFGVATEIGKTQINDA